MSRSPNRIWIDVGAHLGEKTFDAARRDPGLRVYAFEPNIEVALQMAGLLANFVVIPVAVDEVEGCADLYVTDLPAASSLLPYNPAGRTQWVGEGLGIRKVARVSTMRLDTFLRLAGVSRVEYLKIDAQGNDLAVVRSLGNEYARIDRIELEVQVAELPLYEGAAQEEEVVAFLSELGFTMVASSEQNEGQERNLIFERR